jgi:glycosyltransferase involved in cell wall biosynthesis
MRPPESPIIFCSTIIPSVGRLTLARAVESVLRQDLCDVGVEVIVVNDSGRPLPEGDWQKSERVQIVNTNRHERSVARNTGATLARGKYLHFLDDDDWIVPGSYQHLWELSQASGAKWLYGMTQLTDRQNRPTIQLRHELHGNCFLQAMAGEWIPLQSSFIERKAFLKNGGFNPVLAGPEDIDLLRRMLLVEETAETPHIVATLAIGAEGTTTDYSRHTSASRQARESILDAPDVYQRMRSSAVDAFWHGRMLRIYLTSFFWNLQRRFFWKATSRAVYALLTLFTAGKKILSPHFWKSVVKPYDSITFAKGFQSSRQENKVGI